MFSTAFAEFVIKRKINLSHCCFCKEAMKAKAVFHSFIEIERFMFSNLPGKKLGSFLFFFFVILNTVILSEEALLFIP